MKDNKNEPSFTREATNAPIKEGGVGPMPLKRFGSALPEKQSTPAPIKEVESPAAWAGHKSRGTNDIADVSTMTPLERATDATVKPKGWPAAFRK